MITFGNIGIRLAEVRQSGMTQTQIANCINVHQSTIAHDLTGDILPALDTFANLCKLLDVDTNYILCQEQVLIFPQIKVLDNLPYNAMFSILSLLTREISFCSQYRHPSILRFFIDIPLILLQIKCPQSTGIILFFDKVQCL